jgi:hypothetical protein
VLSLRSRLLWLLLAMCLTGCSSRDATYRIVANGKIFDVGMQVSDNKRYLELDGLREILTHVGAVVDINGGDRVIAIAFTNGDDTPQDWPPAQADGAYTIVFNEHVLRTSYVDDEGRPYLPLDAFRSLCVAMKRKISDPPYDELLAICPPDGEALPDSDSVPKGHAVQLPGKGGAH